MRGQEYIDLTDLRLHFGAPTNSGGSPARTSGRPGLSARQSAPLKESPPHGQAKENPT